MDIKPDIERVRNLNFALQDWESITKEAKSIAIYGRGFDKFDIKVKSTPKIDRMENAIINAIEAEQYWKQVFDLYFSEKDRIMSIVYRLATAEDSRLLHKYMIGCSLFEIPLKGKQKDPKNVVNGAIRRLQTAIDREEEAKRADTVRRLINGEKKTCKFCNGLISYKGEESKKLVFVCEGCGKKFKTDKLIS